MIPNEAVEAAAATLDSCGCEGPADLVARAALEAAAPHMLAEAKADAYDEGFEVAGDRYPAFNPYRPKA